VVLRPSGVLNFCVVDEGDSVLIDEARVPLIISGKTDAPVDKFVAAGKLAAVLEKGVHYDVFEKEQTVALNDQGVRDCETALAVANLYDARNPWASYVVNSIKAKELFVKDKSYLVQEGEVRTHPCLPDAGARICFAARGSGQHARGSELAGWRSVPMQHSGAGSTPCQPPATFPVMSPDTAALRSYQACSGRRWRTSGGNTLHPRAADAFSTEPQWPRRVCFGRSNAPNLPLFHNPALAVATRRPCPSCRC
jgi:hypothetical protein